MVLSSGGNHLGKLCIVWLWELEQLGAWLRNQVEVAGVLLWYLPL